MLEFVLENWAVWASALVVNVLAVRFVIEQAQDQGKRRVINRGKDAFRERRGNGWFDRIMGTVITVLEEKRVATEELRSQATMQIMGLCVLIWGSAVGFALMI